MSSVTQTHAEPLFDSDGPRTFAYRPVPVGVPVSLFLGVAGLLGFLTPVGVPVAGFGLLLAAWNLLKIRRSAGEWGGRGLAWTALLLCAIGATGGFAVHSVAYATEVPDGYVRLNYTQDISTKGFVFTKQGMAVHPDVAALVGRNVFLKGYIYPTREMTLSNFVFCRDSGECCFGGTPKIEDMILVTMSGDKTADFYPGLVSVAGTFSLRPEGGQNLSPLFQIDAVQVEPSRTSF